ncbi:MAG: (d)CMP kinase [Clostridia bacterium]|nr:(d)CMP kinase [Clostridia bacterium]
MSFIVAIDGPAGTGKGTITSLISKELGLVNIDTGVTYRCVALYAIRNNIKLEETQKIINSLKNIHIEMKNENGEQKVFLNNEEVTKEIRNKEVTKIVSQVSSIKEVRYKMVELQRKLAQGKDVIMEGRDITTVVFPNANVKIYMDADEKIRAQRRHKEMQEKGIQMTYEEVLKNIQIRDKNDKEKEIGALKIAEDAIYIDTTGLSIEEVKDKILNIIKESRLGTVPNRKQDREK